MRDSFSRRPGAVSLGAALCLGLSLLAAASHASPPVVPGYHRLGDEAKAGPAARGELLLGELNCLACHKAEGRCWIIGDAEAERIMAENADAEKAAS